MTATARARAHVDEVLLRATSERKIPGIVVAIGEVDRIVYLGHKGWSQVMPGTRRLGVDTLFDLASLTKVVATTTMALMTYDEGALALDAPVSRYLPELADRGPGKATVRQLMDHTAGFVRWRPYYRECSSREEVVRAVLHEELVTPPGTVREYSDVHYILLGEIISRVAGQTLDTLAHQRIFEPLGLADTLFNPSDWLRERCASTEMDAATGEPVRGVVHDENARAMGGVSGHAGLFSTAYDLARFAQCMLRRGKPLLTDRAFEAMMTREDAEGSRWLGWDAVSEGGYLSGIFGPRAFGHTGFTGTSLWIDPDPGAFIVVLTNAVHPWRRGDDATMQTRIESYQAGLDLIRSYRSEGE